MTAPLAPAAPGPVCRGDERRRLVRAHPRLNGLDYLEVSTDGRIVTLYFLDRAPDDLRPGHVEISGGRRVTGLRVTAVDICRSEDPERDDCVALTLDRLGDGSCYRLRLVELDDRGRPTGRPRSDMDPRYAALDFTVTAGCPTELDCLPAPCPAEVPAEPVLSYLAKDYASFRRLVLDRLALLAPDWRERHAPDLGVTLVELLAYVGDHLSYQQDAVGAEAYLDTARLRTSVRRHARLVDYPMHEGCNARVWVSLGSDTDVTLDVLAFVTSLDGLIPGRPRPTAVLAAADLEPVPADAYAWFEPIAPGPVTVRAAHSEIRLYTWGVTECCLPAGATAATLVDGYAEPAEPEPDEPAEPDPGQPAEPDPGERADDELPRLLRLHTGDLLLFEEVLGPVTGSPADADPAHRHVVRLTEVEPGVDPLTDQPIVEVGWTAADALPFPLCLSAVGPAPECAVLDPVSVARGTVVAADHGRTRAIDPATVPTVEVRPPCADGCPDPPVLVPGRFSPILSAAPLTHAAAWDAAGPATHALDQDPRAATPALVLRSSPPPGGTPGEPDRAWTVRADLVASDGDARDVVVEVDDDGVGHLRFGDGTLGRPPEAGETFTGRYRVGNGPAGNVGAGTIRHVVLGAVLGGVDLRVDNPMPARGGVAPEPVADVRVLAPHAFRHTLQRAITADDYATLATREAAGAVQRSAAELRWTGSWYEVRVALDPAGTAEAPTGLVESVHARLETYRRVLHDLLVVPATQVPLEVDLLVCVDDRYRRGDVAAAVTARLGSRRLPDGGTGLFHPDRLTVGESVPASRIIGEAARVPGVLDVSLTRLSRLGEGDDAASTGLLVLTATEVARLDNDPSAPENGVLRLDLRGGR